MTLPAHPSPRPLLLALLAALACRPEPTAPAAAAIPTTDRAPSSGAPGVIVLAGGGTEGNPNDTQAWSYRLYRHLVLNGDVTGDGVVSVAVVSRFHETAFIPNYFHFIGKTLDVKVDAANYEVATVAAANDPAIVAAIGASDAVFIKGGDQGQYYDLWNGTLVEEEIRRVAARGGALGGTSAGAMSLAQYCLCSGQDYVSADVLSDAKTPYLDDLSHPATSGIHADFLPYVANTTIDTHLTERGRLGRMLGTLAKATDDFNDRGILAVGIERTTGLVVRGGVAEVVGDGEVAFVRQTAATTRIRDAGRPLVYTHLREDRLTEGWRFDLTAREVLAGALPTGVTPVRYAGDGAPNAGALTVDGGAEGGNASFELVAAYTPDDYAVSTTTAAPFVRQAVGFTNAQSSSTRGSKHETLFRALYDRPDAVGMLLFAGGRVEREAAAPDRAAFAGTSATVVIDAKGSTFKGLSPYIAPMAIEKKGTLRAAALTDLTVHVLGESAARGLFYDTRTHAVVR